MPVLNWIGKEKIVNHHIDVNYRLLEKKYTFGSEESENMIIHGDNLEALKTLLPKFENRIDCIYIDPPYNTGEKKWIYNDDVNDPKIRAWLGQAVGDDEDLSKHDKWLCMMYPRLKLLQKLLAADGRIFISIDEHELYNLKYICDEIFGSKNFAGQFMWYKSETPPNLSYKIKRNLEYILCYEKNKTNIKFSGIKKISPSDDPLTKPQNTFKILKFKPGELHFKGNNNCIIKAGIYGTKKYPNKLLNDLVIENGLNANEVSFENRFIWIQETLEKNIKDNVRINLSKNLVLSYKREEYSPEVPPNLIDGSVGVSTTEEAGKELNKIFENDDIEKIFDYPKDVSLISYLLKFVDKKDAIILDSFAGSGTTAHSVLKLNQDDNGSRKFILVELMDYAETITAERVKRVINGYGKGKEKVNGIKGDFSFYELGQYMFDGDSINADLKIEDIKKYIFYSETRKEISKENINSDYFIGKNDNTSYYLIYNKEKESVLNYAFLDSIKLKDENYVIYADKCTLSQNELEKYSITFKKISRDIIRF